jgi:enoyl-CoA hydratase
MFFGEPVPVETALAWGLVDRVVPPGEAVKAALAMADRLAVLPNVALQLCKQAIGMTFDRPARDAVEATLALSDRAFRTADCAEGVRAFFAKETPRFQHR